MANLREVPVASTVDENLDVLELEAPRVWEGVGLLIKILNFKKLLTETKLSPKPYSPKNDRQIRAKEIH